MSTFLAAGSRLEKLWTGAEWTEGPLWLPDDAHPAGGTVIFSDIPNDRVLEYDPASGETAVRRHPVDFLNGRTLDHDGAVIHCSHGGRRLEIERDHRDAPGETTALVDRWEGGRFNSPNDVVVVRDGSVWFTDPPYGIDASGREGHPGESEYGGCYVFRLDPGTGSVTAVVTDMVHPNGLAFSPDESLLYVADTGTPRNVRVYELIDGIPTAGRDLLTVPGAVDGLRIDSAGRLWCSSADGVHIFDADGRPLEHLPVPEIVSNLCVGGADGDELYITASTSLYRYRIAGF